MNFGDTEGWFTTALSIVIAFLSVLSCQKVTEMPLSEDGFVATIVDGSGTRTSLDGNRIEWTDGDVISVNGVNYIATPQADASIAVFSKGDTKEEPSGPFTAFYPASIFNGTDALLPAELSSGSFSINPMCAESDSHSLEFRSLCAVLAVTVDKDDMPKVRKIRVSSGNLAVSGAFTVSDGTAVLKSPEAKENTVTLDLGDEGTATGDGVTFYIPVPAQTYRNLKVALSDDGSTFTKSMTTNNNQDISVEANTLYPFNFKNGYEPLLEGMNIYGYVHCGDKPVPGVVVTDGYEFAVTDSNGLYQLNSDKKYGFVQISIPSGYRVPSKGVIPKFFAKVTNRKTFVERHDFALVADADQTRHTMLFFTDIHLAGRIGDVANFQIFESDVNSYLAEHPSENVFGATMGDMTFDTKWYQYNFFPSNYVANVDSAFKASNLQIFHCIGNHDHEKGKKGAYPKGEIACSKKYKEAFGPNFYSYNIGKIHYVCLDDIYCTNDGTGDTSYECMVEPYMLEWLKKDLSYVDQTTPVVLQIHAPIFNYKGEYYSGNAANKEELIAALGGRRTYVLSGHTHMLFTIDRLDDLNLIDLNSGSVCGTWWVTQYYNPAISLNREGTPAGYRIFKVDGTDVTWQYKAYGRSADEQIRTYDLDNIDLRWQNWAPNINQQADTLAKYAEDVSPYNRSFSNRNVFFVVYDYDPKWKIDVYEDGVARSWEIWQAKDPLHLVAYETIKYDRHEYPDSGYMTMKNFKMFRVVCSSATSTVTIRVTDRFGRVYSETMARPKPFSIAEYSK